MRFTSRRVHFGERRLAYRRRLTYESLEARQMLAVVTVTNIFDLVNGDTTSITQLVANPGADGISLREAIQATNNSVGGDEIAFAAALSGQQITLTSGELMITEALTIDASSLAENMTIDANQQSRVFNITAATGDIALAGLTLTGGKTTGNNSVFEATFSGGAIRSLTSGNLVLVRCTVTGNRTEGQGARGGSIYVVGDVTLTKSNITGNSTLGESATDFIFPDEGDPTGDPILVFVPASGGGVYARGRITLTDSKVSGNSTAGGSAEGGGLYATGVMLTQSTVSGNGTTGSGARGGGIRSAYLSLIQSTVSGNNTTGDLADGGGIFVQGNVVSGSSVTVVHSTITDNHALQSAGGGLYQFALSNQFFLISNSIVAGNAAGGVGADLIADQDSTLTVNYSLLGVADDLTLAGDVGNLKGTAANPLNLLLSPLTDNDGFVLPDGTRIQTHALLTGSPALNAGDPAAIAGENGVPLFDQRGDGFSRVVGGRIDMGAFEGSISNSDPQVPNPGPRTSVEGSTFSINGLFNFTDADATDTHTATVDWGDSNPIEQLVVNQSSGGGSLSGSHVFVDNGTYLVTVIVFDSQGGDDVETFAVTVANAKPNLVVAVDQTVAEGVLLDLSGMGVPTVGLFIDAGREDTFEATIDWDDGTAPDNFGLLAFNGVGAVGASHVYAAAGLYTVTVTVADDDGGSDSKTFVVTVQNAPPALVNPGDQLVAEGQLFDLLGANGPLVRFTDGGVADSHVASIDWGDGSSTSPATVNFDSGSGSIAGSHVYADDGNYLVTVTVTDDEGAFDTTTFRVSVGNVAPNLSVTPSSTSINEGQAVSFAALFGDPGFDHPANPAGPTTESFAYDIDWGDGRDAIIGQPVADANGGPGTPSSGAFGGSHSYADGGIYTVTVTLRDDDGGSESRTFEVMVANVGPALSISAGPLLIIEGDTVGFNAGFTDPGFDNPDGATVESFTYDVDWGDGRDTIVSQTIADVNGDPGTPSNGTFSGSHTYADNGVYVVTITVRDDDGCSQFQSFTVTVENASPTLTNTPAPSSVNEGGTVSFDVKFNDPGFDNSAVASVESFRYFVDWGDGRDQIGSLAVADDNGQPGIRSNGSFAGSHTYADDGVYTVTIRLADDDMSGNFSSGIAGVDYVERMFAVTVNNVAPTLVVTPSVTAINEGQSVGFTAIFSDPGFDNPANPAGPTTESFDYEIDWGDGRDAVVGQAVADVDGSPGVASTGSFGGTHVYADDGTYTLTVTIRDDDGSSATQQFFISAANADPMLTVVPNQVVDEDTLFNLSGMGGPFLGSFIDAGSLDTHIATVDWGDGLQGGTVTVLESNGSGTLGASHVYSTPGTYQVKVTVQDGDGGQDSKTFMVEVTDVIPAPQTFTVTISQDEDDGNYQAGDLSLREAIRLANESDGAADTILFHPDLNGATIRLTRGELKITDSVTIDASGLAGGLTIDASGNDLTPSLDNGDGSRVFNIIGAYYMSRLDVAIEGLKLTGGDSAGDGGAILSMGDLTLRRMVIRDNHSTERGGGVRNSFGSLTVEDSTLSGNSSGSLPVVTDGTLAGFVSSPSGGGIYIGYGQLTIKGSTIVGNSSDAGGGAFSQNGDVNIVGSTFGQNSGRDGGGGLWIENDDPNVPRQTDIRYTTIYRNLSDSTGGGLRLEGNIAATISHTIVAGNTVAGQPSDLSFSDSIVPIIQFSLVGTTADLRLGPLADNGGTTQTYALLPGSPAFNAGDPSAAAGENGVPQFDQRGDSFARVRGGQIDVGAFEVQNVSPDLIVPGPHSAFEGSEFDISALVSFTDPDATDQHTETVNWGEGFDDEPVDIDEINGSWFVLGRHTYRDNGPFLVTVTVSDGFYDVSKEFMVNVANVAPSGAIGSNGPVIEGSTAIVSFSGVSDPSEADQLAGFHYAYDFDNDGTFDDGDGTYAGSVSASSRAVPAAFLAAGPGTRRVRARIIDKDGDSTDSTTDIIIQNDPPSLVGAVGDSIFENQIAEVSATIVDAGPNEVFSVTVNWRDGTTDVVAGLGAADLTGTIGGTTFQWTASSRSLRLQHRYLDDNPSGTSSDVYDVSLLVSDGADQSAAVSVAVLVANVAPSITADNSTVTVNEGRVAVNSGTFGDVPADVVTLTASSGTVVNNGSGNWSWSFTTQDGPDDSRQVTITAADDDGDFSTVTFQLTVNDEPPTITVDNPSVTVGEGATSTNSGTFGDVPADIVALSANSGTVVNNGNGTWSWSFTTQDGPDDSRQVTITATDDDGQSSSVMFQLTVNNLPPALDGLAFTPQSPRLVATQFRIGILSGTYSDPGRNDTHTIVIDWRDGTVSSPIPVADGMFSIEHVYGTSGLVIPTVRISDGEGGMGELDLRVNVVPAATPNVIVNGAGAIGISSRMTAPLGSTIRLGPTTILDADSDFLKEVRVAVMKNGVSAAGQFQLDPQDSSIPSTIQLQIVDGELLLTASPGQNDIASAADFQTALQKVVFNGASTGAGTAAILVMATDDTDLVGVAEIGINLFEAVIVDPHPPEVDPPESVVVPPTFLPPTSSVPPIRPIVSQFAAPTSDGGAGGKYLDVEDQAYEPADDALAAERALQALLSNPRALRREEIVDAVYALGDVELVSLLGLDLGDEPVFREPRKPPKSDRPAEAAQQPLEVVTGKPVLPDDSDGKSAYWAAAAVSGAIWVGGAWWWRRRRQHLTSELAGPT